MAVARRRPRSRLRTSSVRHARIWLASLSLLALVVAIVSAGQRYFYCPAMDRSAFSACCEHDAAEIGADPSAEAAFTESASCCESRTLEANGPYASAQSPPPVFAPLVAILPALFALPELTLVERVRIASAEIRAGPSPGEARAALQVYLC